MSGGEDDGQAWNAFYRDKGREVLAPKVPRDDAGYFLSGQRELRHICARFVVGLGGVAVEIGCGDGRVTRSLVTMFNRVYALDVASDVLDACRELLRDFQHVHYLCGGPSALDTLPDSCADYILSSTVLQHVHSADDVKAYIAQASRLVTPDGVATLQLRNPRRLTRLRDVALDTARAAAHSSLPVFNVHWRGATLTENEARAATGRPASEVGWFIERHHVWLVIRPSGGMEAW